MTTRAQVYAAIDGERTYQDTKTITTHGDLQTKPLECYLLYMEDYMREAREQASRIWGPSADVAVLNTLRKIAALAVCAMEQHGAPKR